MVAGFVAALLVATHAGGTGTPPLNIGPTFGQDYGGGDYTATPLHSNSSRSTQHYKAVALECLASCVQDARCCAWTYCLPHSATEPGPERCSLKNTVPTLNTASGCGWTGLAPRAVGPNNTITPECGGGAPGPPSPSPPDRGTFNTTTQFHPLTAAGGTGDASGTIQTSDGRWHIFPDCHPTVDPAKRGSNPGYDGMGWAHLSSDDLVSWTDHGMAMQPGRTLSGGYVPLDEAYDNALMDTGSTSTLPNGTVFAIISGVNSSSIKTNSTYDGNMIAAVALDSQLLRWRKLGTVISNPTNTSHPTQLQVGLSGTAAFSRDTPAPGQLPRYSFRDPTSPWLDACVVGKPELCFFLLVGSGNATHNMALLYRSRSDTDIESEWSFVKVLWSSQTNDEFDHACPGYFCICSCPDFFRLSGEKTVFL